MSSIKDRALEGSREAFHYAQKNKDDKLIMDSSDFGKELGDYFMIGIHTDDSITSESWSDIDLDSVAIALYETGTLLGFASAESYKNSLESNERSSSVMAVSFGLIIAAYSIFSRNDNSVEDSFRKGLLEGK